MYLYDLLGQIDNALNQALNQAVESAFGDYLDKSKNNSGYELFLDILLPERRNNLTGRYGEALTKATVVNEIDGYYKVLSNILVPIGNVKTEIDLLMFHEKGIFVFESKNYSGWIFGSDNQKQWTQSLPGGRKYRFYNPIWQNKTHCDAIRNLAKVKDDDIFSYIVFSDRCAFKSVPMNTQHRKICHRYLLGDEVRKELSIKTNTFSRMSIDELYNYFKQFVPTQEELNAHKNRIKNYKK